MCSPGAVGAAVLDRLQRRCGRRGGGEQGGGAADGTGFNAATLTYGDLVADGVVDPVKVTRSAVLNAVSVARMVLTTESAIVEKPAEEPEPAGRTTTVTRTEFVKTATPGP